MYLAENSVKITNNVNVSSNTSGGTNTSHTSITTTTNGETTHVESNENGELHVETKDGKTHVTSSPGMKVAVNNSSDADIKVEDTLTRTIKSASKSGEKITKDVKKLTKEIRLTIWQQLEVFFKNFFKN